MKSIRFSKKRRYIRIRKDNNMKRFAYFLIALLSLFSVSAYAQKAGKIDSLMHIPLCYIIAPAGFVIDKCDKQLTEYTYYTVNYKLGTWYSAAEKICIDFQSGHVFHGDVMMTVIKPQKYYSLGDWEQVCESH